MIELEGKYNIAKVFTNNIEEKAISQIIELLNQDFTISSKVRIMPDCHFGAGCVIGFTADLGNKVIPNLVGVDIGCGMFVVKLGNICPNLEVLDYIIHNFVPSGKNVHKTSLIKFSEINNLICLRDLKDGGRFNASIGTLGGGNHFIEINKDEEDNYYLVIHSGSRNLGKQVADFYQNYAIENCKGLGNIFNEKLKLIQQLKSENKQKLIQSELRKLEEKFRKVQPRYPKDLCFLEKDGRDDYLHDMQICQEYAKLNRETMANIILQEWLKYTVDDFEVFHTVHNYIDFKDNIIRKGAVSAYSKEQLIIPINMKDGSILATGKGNPDWNNSAPHGAGRLMGRNEAKKKLSMDEFSETMKGIYSTTVNNSTLDEAPMAYKPIQEILDNIQDTITVDKIIKPVYNYKSAE